MPSIPERSLPVGTVTFLLTDIEGSTRLLSALGDRYPALLATHNGLLRDSIARHAGIEVSTEGDAFFVVFGSALDAVTTAAEAQRGLAAIPGSEPATLRVRMGLHTGEGRLGGDNYVGLDVHRAARIAAAGHGGRVLLSDPTGDLVARDLPEGVAPHDLGEYRLKDLPAAERIWQLDIAVLQQEFGALRSIDARPNNLPVSATQLIGRGAEPQTIIELLRQRRLVTLTGPGGTGKTRLGLALAARLLPRVLRSPRLDRTLVIAGSALLKSSRQVFGLVGLLPRLGIAVDSWRPSGHQTHPVFRMGI